MKISPSRKNINMTCVSQALPVYHVSCVELRVKSRCMCEHAFHEIGLHALPTEMCHVDSWPDVKPSKNSIAMAAQPDTKKAVTHDGQVLASCCSNPKYPGMHGVQIMSIKLDPVARTVTWAWRLDQSWESAGGESEPAESDFVVTQLPDSLVSKPLFPYARLKCGHGGQVVTVCCNDEIYENRTKFDEDAGDP